MSFRETILHEALVIFEQNGIEDITTEALIEALGISRSTLHEIAPSKRNLVHLCIAHSTKTRKALVENTIAEAEHPLEALLQLLQISIEEVYSFSPAFVHDLKTYYPRAWMRLQLFMRLLMQGYIQPLMQQCILQGYLQQQMSTDLMSRMFLSQLQGLLDPQLYPTLAFDYNDLFRTIVVFYLRGCATSLGQEHIEEFTSRAMAV